MMTIHTKAKGFARQLPICLLALAVMNTYPTRALAQDAHSHAPGQEAETKDEAQANALVQLVRDSTARYQDVAVAERDGYALQFGCVSGDASGAMGLHYVNGALVSSGILDPSRPQIVIYEAMPNGDKKLIGADYLLFADAWDKTHSGPPELMGQFFHLFPSPNRFGLPAFYTLHVWAWKNNPNGAFVNWHPNVSCAAFAGTKQ